MKEQHAPTPWKVNRISRWHDGTPQEFDLLAVVSSQGYQLATTHNCKPQSIATANLIAAAPDLLRALENLVTAVALFAHNPDGWDELKQAQAAIAKATNNQHPSKIN